MIGIGWTEMLVIGVVALIFIGPKELPAMMQRVGKTVGAIRRMGQEFQREINRSTGLDTVTDLRRSITEPLKKTSAEIAREFNRTTPAGQVQPSGALKPADPKAESVVKEIHAAAGIAAPVAAAVAAQDVTLPAAPAISAPAPVVEPAAETPRVRAARRRTASTAPAAAPAEAPVPATPRPRRKSASRKTPADRPADG